MATNKVKFLNGIETQKIIVDNEMFGYEVPTTLEPNSLFFVIENTANSTNRISYPFLDNIVYIQTFNADDMGTSGTIFSRDDGVVVIDTNDCGTTGEFTYSLCSLTLPAGSYKLSSGPASGETNDPYNDKLYLEVYIASTGDIVSCDGFNGSKVFSIPTSTQITVTYKFEMNGQGSYYQITPSLTSL